MNNNVTNMNNKQKGSATVTRGKGGSKLTKPYHSNTYKSFHETKPISFLKGDDIATRVEQLALTDVHSAIGNPTAVIGNGSGSLFR